jgi:uncharacterized membrane protein YraQ (UPF0718 family)
MQTTVGSAPDDDRQVALWVVHPALVLRLIDILRSVLSLVAVVIFLLVVRLFHRLLRRLK